MMRTRYAWLIVGLMACTKAGPTQESSAGSPEPVVVAQAPAAKFAQPPPPAPTPPPAPPTTPTPPPAPPAPPPAAAKVNIQMTAATLADDCGGFAVDDEEASTEKNVKAKAKSAQFAKADRGCDQSSMQLSIKMTSGGAATQLTVKKVELFDDKGTKIGTLTARTPTIWSKDGMYKTWDQKIAPGKELSVSYALSEPPWGTVNNRRNRTYVLKAVVTVGGTDQRVQRDVHIAAPTSLPPGVKT